MGKIYHKADHGLILGSGIVGNALASQIKANLVAYRSIRPFTEDSIDQLLETLNPSFVICAFGLTDVAKCELNKELAHEINAYHPSILAKSCTKKNIYSLYLSSDYAQNPICAYGISKHRGEQSTFSSVLRFNYFTHNHWLFSAIKNKETVNALRTNIFNPVSLDTVVESIIQIIKHRLLGTYNIGLATYISYFDLAVGVSNYYGQRQSLVIPIDSISLPYPYQYDTFIKPNLPFEHLNSLTLRDEISRL